MEAEPEGSSKRGGLEGRVAVCEWREGQGAGGERSWRGGELEWWEQEGSNIRGDL